MSIIKWINIVHPHNMNTFQKKKKKESKTPTIYTTIWMNFIATMLSEMKWKNPGTRNT